MPDRSGNVFDRTQQRDTSMLQPMHHGRLASRTDRSGAGPYPVSPNSHNDRRAGVGSLHRVSTVSELQTQSFIDDAELHRDMVCFLKSQDDGTP